MQRSAIFENNHYLHFQEEIKAFINRQTDFLSGRTVSSTRAVGDAIQNLLEEGFGQLLGDHIQAYSSNFARRSMADLAFTDKAGFYHIVDIKTHRLDTAFNMPNLTSVERLSRYYEDDRNYFDLLIVAYAIDGFHIQVEKVHFVPVEFLEWSCLTLGALGWGQIQIANSNRLTVNPSIGRKRWMIQLCDTLMEFYPAEILKIDERMKYFKKVREVWLQKSE